MMKIKTRTKRRSRGLTLIELLLALAGMSLIGSAVASMLVAVSYGTKADKDLRSLITKQMALRGRISAAIRESAMVLEQGDGYVFLWTFDSDGSGTPNLDEIVLIEFNAIEETLSAYRAPDTPTSNPEYDLSGDFLAQTSGVKSGADFPATRWASGISDFAVVADNASVQSARLVSYRLTLRAGEESDEVIGAAALRNGGDE